MQLGNTGNKQVQACVTYIISKHAHYNFNFILKLTDDELLACCNQCSHLANCEYSEITETAHALLPASEPAQTLVIEDTTGSEFHCTSLGVKDNTASFRIDRIMRVETPSQKLERELNEVIAECFDRMTTDAPRVTSVLVSKYPDRNWHLIEIGIDTDEIYGGMPEILSYVSELYDNLTSLTGCHADIKILKKYLYEYQCDGCGYEVNTLAPLKPVATCDCGKGKFRRK